MGIRTLVVDDEQSMREFLAICLRRAGHEVTVAKSGSEALEKLRTKLPETKVLVLAIFPRGENNENKNRKVNAGANAIIAKLADDKSVFFLDIGPKFTDASGNLSKEVMPDLLHLNEKSYRTWAESTEEMVKKLMGE